MLTKLFGVVGDIPGINSIDTCLTAGELGKFLKLRFCGLQRSLSEISNKPLYPLYSLCHSGFERHLGIVIKTQQPGLLSLQFKKLDNELAIIPLTSIGPRFARPGDIGLIGLSPKGGVLTIGHKRDIGGGLESEYPALLSTALSLFPGEIEC